MFIKKGSRVYSDVYGFGTALTDEENHIGAVVKFDRENKNLLSAKEISFEMAGDLDYFFESLYLNFCSHLDKDYAKKLFGICYSQGNSIITNSCKTPSFSYGDISRVIIPLDERKSTLGEIV